MRGKKVKTAGVVAAAAALVVAMGSSAHAVSYDYYVRCDDGASAGYIDYKQTSSTRIEVQIRVKDIAADGHHARARLVTKTASGALKTWSWHKDLDGSWNGWEATSTYAIDNNGISDVGVQAATYEGDEPLDSCVDWTATSYN